MIEFKKFLLFSLLLNFASCARILGIFPMASYSHFILGETILQELAARGHELTVITPFPQEVPIKNRKVIYVHEMKTMHENEKQDNTLFFEFAKLSSMEKEKRLLSFGYKVTELTLQNEDVRALINSDEQFDLILMESFYNDAFFGFGHKFEAPTVIVSAGGTSHWYNRIAGNPSPPSFIGNDILTYTPNMTFFERLHNTFVAIGIELVTHLYAIPPHNALIQTYFKDAPHVYDLMYNTSLVLMNTYSGFTAPIPLMPNMKEIGGLHVKNNTKLPDDLKKFLDDSTEGVILFALGSNLKSKDLAPAKLKALLAAFKRWKKPVLWKFEGDNLAGKSDNIKIVNWLPQEAVLAHPNVKAFITHGGRLSTLESIYYGVPIIGFAIFAEQPFNIAQAVHAGYGLSIDFHNFTADDIYNAMVEITENPRYGEKAKILSKGMQSRNALDESIYWIEYVIQLKGAPHLRSFGVNLPFYQYLLIDVLFVVVLGCSAAIVCAFIISCICCRSKPKRKEKVK